jgi:predicted deacylase
MKVSKRLIDISGLRDIIQRRIPVLTLDSKIPGPVVWLTACIHGDEVGGTGIVHDVFKELRKTGMKCGAVYALPLINSMGFENGSRYLNAEREDLNRCFPGDARGTMGEQIARRLFDTIMKTQPNLVIDLHNDWIHSVLYALIEPDMFYSAPELRRDTLAIAHSANILIVEDSETFHSLRNTLTGAMVESGIPAFSVESGGAYAIAEESVASCTQSVLMVLSHLGMIELQVPPEEQPFRGELLKYSNRPICSTSGLIRFEVSPGENVKAGQIIGRVYSAFGSCEETLRARGPGYVLGLADHARVVPGCEVIAIAETDS